FRSWIRSWTASAGSNFSSPMSASLRLCRAALRQVGIHVPQHGTDAALEVAVDGVAEILAGLRADRAEHDHPRQQFRGAAGARGLHLLQRQLLQKLLVVAGSDEVEEPAVERLVYEVVAR